MARGGKRHGAGRKPKHPSGIRARVLAHPSVPMAPPSTNEPSPVEEFDAPDDLEMEERAVWLKQAPHAFRSGKLTRATALQFERYCKLVVAERGEAKGSSANGSNHRGLLKLIVDLERAFDLGPVTGRPAVAQPHAAPQDADDAFFGGASAGR